MPNGRVQAVFTFSPDPLPADTPFSFVISNIGSPSSTKPVEIDTVDLYAADKSFIPELTNKIPTFSMKFAAEVTVKSLTLDTYSKGAKTGFTITYTTMNKMDPLSFIVISYPLTANFHSALEITCAVQVESIVYTHSCRLDRRNREIFI